MNRIREQILTNSTTSFSRMVNVKDLSIHCAETLTASVRKDIPISDTAVMITILINESANLRMNTVCPKIPQVVSICHTCL